MEDDKKDEEFNLTIPNIELIGKYSNIIIMLSIIAMLFFTSFAAFGIGAFYVCHSLDGFLDNKAQCHLDYYSERERIAELNRQKMWGNMNDSIQINFN